MRYIYYIFNLVLLFSCSLLHAQEQPTLNITNSDLYLNKNINESLSIFVDESTHLNIDDILVLDSTSFISVGKFPQNISSPTTLWLKLKINNQTEIDRNFIFQSTDCADSIKLYEVTSGKIRNIHTNGHAYHPAKKEIPSGFPLIPISLSAQSSSYYYIKVNFPYEISWQDCYHFNLKEGELEVEKVLNKYAGQVFYAGLMLMFSLLSFFTFLLFKDKDFIYFGIVHIAFAFYFLVSTGSFAMFVYNLPFIQGIRLQYFGVSFLILSLSIFIARYLKLKEKNKRYYTFYIIISLITIFNSYPIYFYLKSVNITGTFSNISIVIWMITAIIPMVKQAKLGDKSAINLLAALSLLTISAIIYILTIIKIIPSNFFTKNSFQISTVLFSLLVFYHLFKIVREIDAEKVQAHSLNELKSKFFTNISHEFRTPLTLIIGPLRQLIDKSTTNDKDTKLIKGALENSNRLLNMVNQLLDLSRIESKNLRLNLEKNEYISFIKGLLMSFESLAETKQISIKFNSSIKRTDLWYDIEKMEIILFNLLSNAFKFTAKGGKVSLLIEEENKFIKISITDTGIGILPSQLPYVFDRFFRVANSGRDATEGSGIGLSLAKELVELHHGKISVESEINKGTTFTLQLKKGKAHFHPEELSINDTSNPKQLNQTNSTFDLDLLQDNSTEKETTANIKSVPKFKKPTILLVEDNKDVRQYLKDLLIEQFDILEANNGQKGFEIATEQMPELVISDVMMPVMNGFEFCKKVKQDVRTSHIPVILLTAKAENEHKLAGLELGADDYLLKPFHAKELNIRVRKLIEIRVQLRKKLLESPTLTIQNLEGNPVENRFIKQISNIINDNLESPQFGVNILAEKIGLSRSQLNRKIKSITEMTANKYIQYIRLQKALLLLETTDMNVSEVTFEVGFSSVAYFVKCFGNQFGKTPGSFQKKN